MDIKDRITFRQLQAAFFAGMVEYPNDTDRMEKGMGLLEAWIDQVVDREVSKVITQTSTLTLNGIPKSRKHDS
jgi:hypothetical protein